jgi:hypothetical protein
MKIVTSSGTYDVVVRLTPPVTTCAEAIKVLGPRREESNRPVEWPEVRDPMKVAHVLRLAIYDLYMGYANPKELKG